MLILEFSLNFISQLERILITEWKREGKIGRSSLWICEHMIEAQAKLLLDVQECGDFVKDPSPLFWLCDVVLDGKHWSKTLIIQFLLKVRKI